MAKTNKMPFFADGLRFSCIHCSECCRVEPGYVFLSQNDLRLLAEGLQMGYNDIVERYCRWVPSPGGEKQLSLKETPDFDCIFWQDRCNVYPYRPLQCKTFPFWDSTLNAREAWEELPCPGKGKGKLHSREYIESCLARRRAESVITRGA
ncbi:MAG: YkgJ family cysteine cluster protein [Treponema sp.]|nr:YkgJ family cysteine cluster protein [Treponema sp.]